MLQIILNHLRRILFNNSTNNELCIKIRGYMKELRVINAENNNELEIIMGLAISEIWISNQ